MKSGRRVTIFIVLSVFSFNVLATMGVTVKQPYVLPFPEGLPPVLSSAPAVKTLSKVDSFVTDNGYMVYTQKLLKAPKVQLSVIYGVGTRIDKLRTQLIARMLKKGVAKQSHSEFARTLARYGIDLEISAGTHFTTISLVSPASKLEQLFSVVNGLIFSPTFSEVSLDDSIREIKVISKAQQYSAGYLAEMLWQRLLFGESHLWVPQWFDKKSFKRQAVSDIKTFYQKHYLEQPLMLSIVGDIDELKLKRIIEQGLNRWPITYEQFSTIEIDLPFRSYKESGLSIHLVDLPKSKQVEVRVGLKTVSSSHPDWPALFILADVLGGSSGRLYSDLREKRGLTYGVYAKQSKNPNRDGYFQIYGSTKTEKLAAFLKAISGHWLKLPETLTKEELRRSKSKLLGRYKIKKNGMSYLKDTLNDKIKLGKLLVSDQELYQKISDVNLDDLKRVAEKYNGQDFYWVVSGDAGKIKRTLKKPLSHYKVIQYDRELE